MKICPKCQQTYPNDNQGFCLNDGTTLNTVNPGVSEPIPETVLVNPTPSPASPNQSFGNAPPPQNNWSAPQQQVSMQPQKGKSKTWIWVAGILGALVLLCGGGLVGAYFLLAEQINETLNGYNSYSNTTPYSTPTGTNTSSSPSSPSTQVLSSEKFNQIKNDMSRAEVERILGGAGKEISNTKAGSYTIMTHEWKGAEYSVIYVVYRNDKVFSKTSANLK